MQTIPTLDVPAQTFTAVLSGQQAQITLRQLSTGLYMDLQSNGLEIVGLVLCQNKNRIVRDLYLGFQGDFVFLDTTGAGQDPSYVGLGSQFALIYIEPAELPAGIG
jgi:hypothetical protein